MSSLKAAAVSRYLGEKGHRRSDRMPNAQVSGWFRTTTGFKCEDSYDFNHKPIVRVTWVPGDDCRHAPIPEVAASVRANVVDMQKTLSERYDVRLEEPDVTFGGDPYLLVSKREDDEDE